MTTKQQYNYEYLHQFCEENSIILSKDYSQENVNRDTKIEGNCKTDTCDEIFCKTFRQLSKTVAFCKDCTSELRKEKVKNTNKILYGVEYTGQINKNQQRLTCLKKYGVQYPGQNQKIKQKIKFTNLEKYGSICPFQNEKIRDKGKETCFKKYGDTNYNNRNKYKTTCQELFNCNNPSQNELIKSKKIETCLINHGVEHPLQNEIIKEKTKNTNVIKYGGNSPMCSNDIQKKSKQTSLINYGVEYPMQNAEYANNIKKHAYLYKSYTYPSGNIIEIQGYEHYALDEILQKENILENDIITSRIQVPEIWYLDSNSKKHRYYVDIFILSQNRMIEVKSTYTIKLNNDTILLKQQACKDAGYSCEIWVYNSNGEKVECIL
jgi:hypothetical protein